MTSRKTSRAAVALTAAVTTLLAPTLLAPSAAQAGPSTDLSADPVVIGHRGASGYRPEHTLASYELAIRQGADYIEPDLVSTKDGVLVARHENEISGTTDVADHPEFADRRTTKVIDGRPVTGWFTEDFTYQELRTLRAVERLPEVRPDNTAYDGDFRIPTLDEVLKLARREGVGVYPETKHPSYFDSIGLSLEEPLVAALARRKMDDADDEVIIQSFEVSNLRELDTMVDVDLAQLVDGSGGPADLPGTTYASMVTAAGLRAIATYADGVGAAKNWVLPRDASGARAPRRRWSTTPTPPAWSCTCGRCAGRTSSWPANFRVGTDPNAPGDLYAESRAFLDAGVDGLFSDNPDIAARALADWLAEQA